MVRKSALTSGDTLSCGCFHRESFIKAHTTHGHSKDPLYMVWAGIMNRCCNPKSPAYENYGGRGITVCNRWLNVSNFITDIKVKPFHNAEIDRIDNEKGYSPDNCKWSTITEQNRNKRNNRMITYQGVTLCLAGWSEKTGVSIGTLHARLKYGWSIERVINEPIRAYYTNSPRNRVKTDEYLSRG